MGVGVSTHDGGTPPPPPPTAPVAPATAAVTVPRRRGPSRFVVFLLGLVIGVLGGGAAGYLIFNGRTVTITNQPQPSASATAAARATPTPTPAPTPTATAAPLAAGIVPCPVTAPPAQHPIGQPAPASPGEVADPTLDFCGVGNATLPAGTARFTTADNWGLGIADSCPNGSAGPSGMGTVLTIAEVIPGGGAGPDSATEPGDWADSGGVLMAHGGSFQLRVTTVAPGCVWRINIYPAA